MHERILGGQTGDARVGAVDGRQRLRALPQQPGAGRLPARGVELTLDAPDDGLARDLVADQKRIAQCGRRIVGDEDVGDRCAGGSGGGLGACLQLHAGVHVVGRAGAQDQRPASIAGDGVERPRGPAGAPGQRAQVFNRDIGAEDRRQHARQFGGEFGAQLLGRRHLPNLNSRCATRRIWISSAPSVIR